MWNIPNMITMVRVILIPLILWLIWPGKESQENCFWAALIFAFGATLDAVDGYIARRFDWVTVLGKFLDPLADKLFYLTILIGLLQLPGPRVPAIVVIIIVARELAITGLRAMAAAEGIVIAAGTGGKIKTAFASVGAVFLLLHYPYSIESSTFSYTFDLHQIGLWLTYISLYFAISSGYQYGHSFFSAINDKKS